MSENKFSDRLSEAIKASGKTQTKIAELAGITAPYLSDLKKGNKGNPSHEVLKKLADSLGTTPAWLMSYRDAAGISVVGGPEGEPVQQAQNVTSEGKTKQRDVTVKAALERDIQLLTGAGSKIVEVLEALEHCLETMVIRDTPYRAKQMELCAECIKDFDAWVKGYREKKLASQAQTERIKE